MCALVDRDVRVKSARRMLLVGVVCIAATLGGPAVGARQATPDAIAPAASCTIAPLTLPLFGGTPATTFSATPAPVDMKTLVPVSAETDASVRAGVAGIVACLNVGDPKQTYAVFTTGYLARTYGNPQIAYLPAFEQSLDEPPADAPPVYTIQGFIIDGETADGRVVVSVTGSAGSEVWASQFVLVHEGEHWLIDEVLS
ncbi:MAG: hypothetical protein QM753_14155 [Thermomicrobiales bacterium]